MTQKQIAENIELDQSLKLVAQSFTEIAAIKLQRIRANIERNRTFFEEISSLFSAVKNLAEKMGTIPAGVKKIGTAAVILTSNSRFYGGLERRLINFYLETSKAFPTQKILIGQSAASFFSEKSIIYSQDLPNEEEIRSLANQLAKFEKVWVFYPRFQSVLVQKPTVFDLGSGTKTDPSKNFNLDYILEPEVVKMWQFFESQITNLLLEQTFLEAELARTAARLVSMDQAQDNADQAIFTLNKTLAASKKSLINTRILETISSLFQFRKEANDFR